jgi:Fe-S-cluster containining protein
VAASLHAPGFVNYACQLCGWCCHQYDISFSRADFERLSKLDWGRLEPALAGKEWAAPLRELGNPDAYRLRYAADGACVFLDGNRCRMHKHVGEFGKTLGCSAYPFTFAATPSGVYTGCRFSCKAMAYGLGEPLARRIGCLEKQLALCVEAGRVPQYGDQVAWDGWRKLPWADYLALEEALIRVFLRDDLPLARRLFLAQKFVDVLHEAKLARVRGPKFREFIGILETGLLLEAETEAMPGEANGLSRMLFRQFCFLFQRRQGGSYREMSLFGKLGARLRTFWTGVQFTFGVGAPPLVAMPGPAPLAKVAALRAQRLDGEAERAISRFLAAKLYGKQHFGKLFFGYPLRPGLEFLLLSAGAVMWYARARTVARGGSETTLEDVLEAIRYVDFCYGYSAAPALMIERLRIRVLSHGDTAIRLVLAQYPSQEPQQALRP